MTQSPSATFLVNNKSKEPNFATSFSSVAELRNRTLHTITSLEVAYSYNRVDGTTSLWLNGTKVDLTTTDWFIRAWAPSEDATALLALFLELKGIPFTDNQVNAAHEIRTSKLSQTFQLAHADLAAPSTWVTSLQAARSLTSQITTDLGLPVVVKTRGGLGNRVWKCDTEAELLDQLEAISQEGKDDLVLFQEMIENQGDIRVVVFQNEVIASVLRSGNGQFLNNVSQGGTASAVELTDEERLIAVAAAKAIRLDLAGVDIVRSTEGPLLFEVNKAPDITSFNDAAGIDIASVIAELYFKNL